MSSLRNILHEFNQTVSNVCIDQIIGWADARCETRGKLTPELIHEILIRIKYEYGTAKEFCAANNAFTPGYISNLFKGKKQRITPKVAVLCDILKIKINEFVIL